MGTFSGEEILNICEDANRTLVHRDRGLVHLDRARHARAVECCQYPARVLALGLFGS